MQRHACRRGPLLPLVAAVSGSGGKRYTGAHSRIFGRNARRPSHIRYRSRYQNTDDRCDPLLAWRHQDFGSTCIGKDVVRMLSNAFGSIGSIALTAMTTMIDEKMALQHKGWRSEI